MMLFRFVDMLQPIHAIHSLLCFSVFHVGARACVVRACVRVRVCACICDFVRLYSLGPRKLHIIKLHAFLLPYNFAKRCNKMTPFSAQLSVRPVDYLIICGNQLGLSVT